MKVRLKTLMAGPEGVHPPGSVIEASNEEAEILIAGGYAESVSPAEQQPAETSQVETAAIDPGTRAVKPAARPRKPATAS